MSRALKPFQAMLGDEAHRTPLGRVLVRNTFFNFSGQFILLASAFLATPYIIHHFGPARYGVLMLLLTFVDSLNFFQLGFNTSLVKYIAEFIEREGTSEINDYVGTALSLFLFVGAVLGAAVILLAHWLVGTVFDVPPDLEQVAVFSFYLASTAFLLRFVAEAVSAIPVAKQRFDVVNCVFVGVECVRIFGSLLVVYLGFLLKAVAAVILFANLLFLLANVLAAKRLVPGLSLKPRCSRRHFRQLFNFSKYVAISSLNSRVGNNLDRMMIGYFLPVAYVGFYVLPYSLCHKIWIMVGNITAVIFPAASSLSVNGRTKLKELYLRSSKVVAAVACFPALALWVLSREALLYWVGPEFAEHGTLPLSLLSCGFLINCLMHVPASISQAMGHPEIVAKFTTFHTLSNVALFLVLIPTFGIAGAAGGFLGTQILLAPWYINATNKLLGVPWRKLLTQAYGPILLPLGVSSLVLIVCRPWISSLLTVGLVGGAGLVTFLVLGIFFILDDKERAGCLGFLGERILGVVPAERTRSY